MKQLMILASKFKFLLGEEVKLVINAKNEFLLQFFWPLHTSHIFFHALCIELMVVE